MGVKVLRLDHVLVEADFAQLQRVLLQLGRVQRDLVRLDDLRSIPVRRSINTNLNDLRDNQRILLLLGQVVGGQLLGRHLVAVLGGFPALERSTRGTRRKCLAARLDVEDALGFQLGQLVLMGNGPVEGAGAQVGAVVGRRQERAQAELLDILGHVDAPDNSIVFAFCHRSFVAVDEAHVEVFFEVIIILQRLTVLHFVGFVEHDHWQEAAVLKVEFRFLFVYGSPLFGPRKVVRIGQLSDFVPY